MDNVILGTGIGLGIIGAITRRTSVMAVGLAFLGVRAYLRWRASVALETPTVGVHMTKEQAAETGGLFTQDSSQIDALVAAWETQHPGKTGYYDPDKGIVVDAMDAANQAADDAQKAEALNLISRSLVLR